VAQVGIKELLEAGVHFGHQTRRWNPKMRRFIFGERGGIYIIDLIKAQRLLDEAQQFAGEVAHRGGTVLFVGTKKQARDAIKEVAEAAGMPYVNHRWLGGLLTNFQTISQRIKRLHDLERYEAEGQLALLPTRERLSALADLAKLRANLGGVKNMKGVPSAIFIVDLKTEAIAVAEGQRLRIPIIGLVDTNCDPDGIDYVIPGNDDAIRSCAAITRAIGDVVAQGSSVYRQEQERIRLEAEERARREAEERARREAEAQARREAEEQAARDAASQAAAAEQAAQAAVAARAAAAEQAAATVRAGAAARGAAAAAAAKAAAQQAAQAAAPPAPEAPAAETPSTPSRPPAPSGPPAQVPAAPAAAAPVEDPAAPAAPAAEAPPAGDPAAQAPGETASEVAPAAEAAEPPTAPPAEPTPDPAAPAAGADAVPAATGGPGQ
jgi:small subunit ribosomal protein S2